MSTPETARDVISAATATGTFVDRQGERYYRITDYDLMPPFLMSIVSDSDHWFFISSSGALTCGRRSPDHALFPYYTDDRIHESSLHTGSRTVLRVRYRGETVLWEPFASVRSIEGTTRSLHKNFCGNRVLFEEVNERLGISFRYEWMNSARFGFIRRSTLENLGTEPVEIEVLDGIQNVLPSGVTRRFQLEYSTLVDGYKRAELDEATGLALFRLTSIPVDRAEPSESLRVSVAWSRGLEGAIPLLSATQIENFRHGERVHRETDVHGVRGAYLLAHELTLRPGGTREWIIGADVDRDAVQVRECLQLLRSKQDIATQVEDDVQRGTQNLLRLVCNADGLQLTKDEPACWHHFSSTLFNAMRGGVPENDYWVRGRDFHDFVNGVNQETARSHEDFLESLPERIQLTELQALATNCGDPDVERLAHEYLPLTFSRRHGDPSRPWNNFDIKLKDTNGRKVIHYEGNWRDIFQNWEALGQSFPGLTRSMLFKFLDSSTADGYNPYHISSEGYDWEVLDPHDNWSYIGYWGDHQVIYLLKLLDHAVEQDPEAVRALLFRRVFTFADVPYRIRSYEEMLRDPRNTIIFDHEAHRKTMARAAELGNDGKALRTRSGELARATLAEKLLIVVLTKLSNFVPEAGIWLNTQRPEWNDANNALVGVGASMVTLCQLRRLIVSTAGLFSEAETLEISAELAALLQNLSSAFESHHVSPGSDEDRRKMVDALGEAVSAYRCALYCAGFSGDRTSIGKETIATFFARALEHVEHSIHANRRSDGLYHSYNLLRFGTDTVSIDRLSEMLEGQVAVLESGLLCAVEVRDLLDALARSRLYRPDQQSYMLYPAIPLPKFLDKNNVPAEKVAESRVLTAMVKAGDSRILVRDHEGTYHFNAEFRNAALLKQALDRLCGSGEFGPWVEGEEQQILALYEQTFDHQSFTGRSGTLYKYEGLGCIYWHMVAKLLVAVQNVIKEAERQSADGTVIRRLKSQYKAIRAGLGTHKTPAVFGAFPFDPHSHTPDFTGAQQPGMSGQAKEDFLSRMGEMGVEVEDGTLSFRGELLASDEFVSSAERFSYFDKTGTQQWLDLPPGSLAFTICQVPVVRHREGPARLEIVRPDGRVESSAGLRLSRGTTQQVLRRSGEIRALHVYLQMK